VRVGANPESGTTSYGYDSEGKLTSRTRPKPNQPNPAITVTTSYSYDQLHRLTAVTYSDGTTPGKGFYYDEASVWGASLQNPIGRLTHTYTGGATNCAANIMSYDAMGRVLYEWQQTPSLCSGSTWPLSYTYDLLGNMKSFANAATFSNGSGATFNYYYNIAGRLTSATSSLQTHSIPAPWSPACTITLSGRSLRARWVTV